MDFCHSHLRKDLKTYFHEYSSSLLEKQFERSKLLLFDNLSKDVFVNAVELSVEMALANPLAYGATWLSDILNEFRLYLNFIQLSQQMKEVGFSSDEINMLLFSSIDSPEKKEEFKYFSSFINQINPSEQSTFLISRTASLMQRMLDYPSLEPYIQKFLDIELKAEKYDTILILIMLLESHPNFSWLDWVKKLLNVESRLIELYTDQILFDQLEKKQHQIYTLLEQIHSWIPKKSYDKQEEYSNAEIYALLLIYKYSNELLIALKTSDYGCYPSKYQLFSYLDDDSVENQLKLLVEWAFDENQEHFIRLPLKSGSLLVANWFCVICGLGSQNLDPRSLNIADSLLIQVIHVLDNKQQRELIQHWNQQRSSLLNSSNRYQEEGQRDLQKLNMQKRESIALLIKRFQTLQKSVSS